MLLEYLCLFVFILRLFHVWCFAAGVKFWRDKKNVILLAIIVVRLSHKFPKMINNVQGDIHLGEIIFRTQE